MGIRTNSYFIFSLLFLFFTFNLPISLGSDSISANQSLSGDQTLVSSNGTFKLGFFQPGNSSNYYICIVYNQVSLQTIAWVANRDTPISDKYSSVLKIMDGNLVLLNESQIPIWSTNQNSTASTSVVAVLGDDGNLIVTDGSNSTQPLWQSFDFPVNTWLPGSKIAYNKITKTHQNLTSWKNSEDPSQGLFSLWLDATNNQYVISWNGSEQYWTSGPWNAQEQIFSLVPEMRSNYIYNFSYVDNENESYFMYWVYNTTIITRFIMDFSGQIKQLTWLETTGQWNLFWSQPREQCEVYAFCGAFGACNQITQPFCNCLYGFSSQWVGDWNLSDYSGGCVRETGLQCGNTSVANQESTDKFYEYPNMGLPDNSLSVASTSAAGCASSCLNNCSCTAYSYYSNGCSIWIGELVNLQQLSPNDGTGRTLYLRLAASEFSKGKENKGIIIGAVAGSVAVVLLLGLVFILIWKRQRRFIGKTKVEGSLVAFGYRDLQIATKNFSEKLGGGGFGSVFKGTLPDSTVIAVKKLESISQGEKQFRSEVSTIGTIQHVNLVRLRGFCSDGNEKLLVYDYMPNGSLDSHLFHEKEGQVLDWKTRYEIALGTARGLTYLHEKCRDCIIHCDIKPENILLDAEFCTKVADFGLAKLVGREFSRVLTTMRGTRGYLAPEWISGVAITAKADVYSYGMMLFELVSGRRNSDPSQDGKCKFFPTWAASVVVEGGDMFSLLDHRLVKNADEEELRRIARVACWCIQDEENHRPTMGQVVQILEGVLEVNPPRIPRSLQLLAENHEHIVFFTDSSSGQSSLPQSSHTTDSSQAKSTSSTRVPL
ncbi:G-type lectin S-receptor-like serine/threonine-protein kinase At2g19130 [Rhododendron vialii]|uniref:G-type lectin S-receptor-like serine/threonine-protein kinase At2g19130 n=1 Tax=Rhododendron vialii TaxID=182163 RepID=UPI00265F61CC|nr:G-type lectin S-receptor-like serine/threonine-protein kinase At2g19130 [Rhododendron vialii]